MNTNCLAPRLEFGPLSTLLPQPPTGFADMFRGADPTVRVSEGFECALLCFFQKCSSRTEPPRLQIDGIKLRPQLRKHSLEYRV